MWASSAAAAYAASHIGSGVPAAAAVHGYATGFLWTAAFFAGGAIICGSLLRWGPLWRQPGAPGTAAAQAGADGGKAGAVPAGIQGSGDALADEEEAAR
jgi:hypothetical protein